MRILLTDTHYYFSSKFAPNLTYDLAGVFDDDGVSISDGPTSMLEANTNKSSSLDFSLLASLDSHHC